MSIAPKFALAAALAVAVLLTQAPRPAAMISMSWRVVSNIDQDSGEKTCRVISLGDDVTARLSLKSSGGEPVWSVTVGFDNQPGSLRYLRIKRELYQTDKPLFSGSDAAAIVALLKTPGDFVYEWIMSPNETKRGALYGNGNFAAKAALCEAWLSATSA